MFELANSVNIDPKYKRIWIDDDITDEAYLNSNLSPALPPHDFTYFEFVFGSPGQRATSPNRRWGVTCDIDRFECEETGVMNSYICAIWVTDSKGTIRKCPFGFMLTPGWPTSKAEKIIWQKKGFTEITWAKDLAVGDWCNLIFYGDECRATGTMKPNLIRDCDDFIRGKAFITNLKNAAGIHAFVTTTYATAQIVAGTLSLMANRVIARETIPATPVPGRASDPVVGDVERLVKIKVTPKVVVVPAKSPTGTGTKQKYHIRRGGYRIKGQCIQQKSDKLNLCEERNTIDSNKSYCGICAKRRTYFENYEAGDANLGRITKSYHLTK